MIEFLVFLTASGLLFFAVVETAFGLLMRLPQRIEAERESEGDALATYLEDPLKFFVPARVMRGMLLGVAIVLLTQLVGTGLGPAFIMIASGLVLSVGDSEYVQSARLLGVSSRRTLFRDVLPNVAGPVLVLMTLDLGTAILLLSGLSFLGLGAQPPNPEWGSMVATGTQYFQQWWIGTFPGLAIFTAVIAFNFLGDSLRDFFDPTSASADRGR